MKIRAVVMLLLLLAPGAALSSEVGWDFVVTLTDPGRGVADVDWTLRGFQGPVRLCGDLPRTSRGVVELRQLAPGAERVLAGDNGCWTATAEPGKALRLRYRYDLAGMAGSRGDPDYVARFDDSYIFQDEAVLLRPDPLPREAPITVEFRLPEGFSVSTPWQREGAGWRFAYDSDDFDCGSYVALGRLHPLGELEVRDGAAALTLVDRPRHVPDEVLRRWVSRALGAVADFYGELPGGQVAVHLVPVHSSRAGVFGTVLRHGPYSAVLFFGDSAEASAFDTDWVAVHELFHLGNPNLRRRLPWFTEGFTTYYQDVLRGRAGWLSPAEAWGDLYDGFRRFCEPNNGFSLAEESAGLHQSYHFTRVYWGGACLAFRLDVAIRRHSGGHASLDSVYRELRHRSEEAPLTEEELISALDGAAGNPLAREHLRAHEDFPLRPLYRQLGIEPTGSDSVRLHDDAPGAAIRRSIF